MISYNPMQCYITMTICYILGVILNQHSTLICPCSGIEIYNTCTVLLFFGEIQPLVIYCLPIALNEFLIILKIYS